jgi:adenylylsulfate kinase-like enzyme
MKGGCGLSADAHGKIPPAAVPGVVIWITGLSGAGKSSLARHTLALLRQRLSNVVMLDGDAVREVMSGDVDHSPQGRLKNAYRISRLCALLADQGIHVVCATMSLFPEIWAHNREHIARYCEVYVRVPLDTLAERDARALYSRAKSGMAQHVVGVDLAFHEPEQPHLVLDNDGPIGQLGTLAQRVVEASHCFEPPEGTGEPR